MSLIERLQSMVGKGTNVLVPATETLESQADISAFLHEYSESDICPQLPYGNTSALHKLRDAYCDIVTYLDVLATNAKYEKIVSTWRSAMQPFNDLLDFASYGTDKMHLFDNVCDYVKRGILTFHEAVSGFTDMLSLRIRRAQKASGLENPDRKLWEHGLDEAFTKLIDAYSIYAVSLK